MTGKEVPALLPYENALRQIMERYALPGASLAIMDGNRLIYARGLGYADREAGTPVQPTSRFRLASISKTITGMTILKLAEEGKLSLDATALSLIPHLRASTTPPPDPRMAQVTVRQLLQHTAGFERDIDDDYVIYYNTASRLFNEPVSIDLMTRYVISQRLDFNPGTKYAYGNSAYQVLGAIIERVTGKKYVDAVQEKILGPAGVTSVQIGGNLLSQRLPDEVRYYDYPGAPLTTTAVAPGVTLPAPRQYNRRVDMGGPYGGLIGNAVDLMRYLSALEGRRGPALLSQASLAAMTARPVPAVWPANATNYTGLTWRITPLSGGGTHWWHSGGASGTRNLMTRRQNGRSWVVLTNSRPLAEDQMITDLFDVMVRAESQVTSWPTHDLFPDFSGARLSTSSEALSFTYAQGSPAPPAQTLQVTAVGGSPALTIDPPAERWLKVDRVAGTTPLTLSISVDAAGLAAGDYQTQLRINGAGVSNGPRLIRVTLRVTPASQFTAIRNAANLMAVRSAAAESRLLVELDEEPASAKVTDSAGVERPADVVELKAKSIDLVVPAGTAAGEATLSVVAKGGRVISDRIAIVPVSPALFPISMAMVVRTAEDGSSTSQPASDGIDLGAETDRVDLVLWATGIRGVTDTTAAAVQIGDESAEVLSIAPGDAVAGVDVVTVRVPRALAGRGELNVVLTAGEIASNALTVTVK